jgi:uncharacterized protein (DUF433 family)
MATLVDRLYTTTEAAAVSGVGVKAVNNAIDKRIIGSTHTSQSRLGKTARRALTEDDVLRLKLWHDIGGGILSQERRERLFDAIRRQPAARTVRTDALLIVDVGAARKQIENAARDLAAAEAMVERKKSVMGGEPVFKGTRIPVRLVAAMLADGASEDEVAEGYPALDRRRIALSRIWAAAHPRRGRPKSLKDRGLTPKSSRRVALKDSPSGAHERAE